MSDNWVAAEKVQKNDKGEYRALIGGAWVPASQAQKNEAGEYRVIRAQPPSMLDLAKPDIGNALEILERGAYNVGGAATDFASGSMSPEAAGVVGTAANITTQALPTALIGAPAKAAAGGMDRIAKWLMQSALRPDAVAQRTGKATKAVDTMLDRGWLPTEGGVSKMRAVEKDLNKRVDDVLQQNPTASVSRDAAASRGQDTVKRFEAQPSPTPDLRAIEGAIDDFYTSNPSQINILRAQELKKGGHGRVGERAYGEVGTARTAAEKDLIRGLKEEIERVAPGVAPLNKELSSVINARKMSDYRQMMSKNANPMPFGASIGMATNNPAAALGLWANASDRAKALAAILLHKGREQIPATVARAVTGWNMSTTGETPEGSQP